MLAQVQPEVNNPLLLNLRPSESAVERAFKLLGEVSNSTCTCRSEEVIVDSGDDGEEDQATVTIGRLGTFSKDSLPVFSDYVPSCFRSH